MWGCMGERGQGEVVRLTGDVGGSASAGLMSQKSKTNGLKWMDINKNA